jgi:hypothetical protein
MIIKAVEIRDKATFVPAIAIQMAPATEGQRYLLRRAGYHDGKAVVLVKIVTCEANYDPYAWGNRTMLTAHRWITEHFDEIGDSGDVVDVEFILGETAHPKRSEQFEAPL